MIRLYAFVRQKNDFAHSEWTGRRPPVAPHVHLQGKILSLFLTEHTHTNTVIKKPLHWPHGLLINVKSTGYKT